MDYPEWDRGEGTRGMRVVMAVLMVVQILAIFLLIPDPTEIKYLCISWFSLLLAALGLWLAWAGKSPASRPSLITFFVVGFCVVNALAAAVSSYPGNSFDELRRWISMAVLYLLVVQAYRTPEQGWRLLAVICVALSLASLYGFVQKAGLDPLPWADRNIEQYRGLPATFGNPNFAGHALVMGLILAAGLSLRRGTVWCLIPAVLMSVHLYWTRMRAAPVALLAALTLMVIVLLVRRKITRPLKAVAVTFLIFAIVCGVGLGAGIGLVKAKTGTLLPADISLMLRYQGYYGAAKMICAQPFLGYGPGNYRIENPRFWTPFEQHWFVREHKMNAHVHNDLLEAGVDAGIPGVVFYLGLLASGVVYGLAMGFSEKNRESRRLGFTLAVMFTAFAVDGLFGFNLRVPVSRILFFVLLGLLEGTRTPPQPHSLTALRRGTPPPASQPHYLTACAVILLALFCAFGETRFFVGQFYYQRAQGAKYWGYSDEAHRCLEKGARLVRWSWDFPRELGILDVDRGRPDEAIEHFREALSCNPNEVTSWILLGRACLNAFAQTQAIPALDGAVEAADRALALCPVSPQTHEILARVWDIRGTQWAAKPESAQDAEKAWRTSIEQGQLALDYGYEQPGALGASIASAFVHLGELDAAEEAFVRAVKAESADIATWGKFADFASTHQRYDKLRGAIETALTSSASLPAPLEALRGVWDSDGATLPDAVSQLASTCFERAKSVSAGGLVREYGWLAGIYALELDKSKLPAQTRGLIRRDLGLVYATLEAWEIAAKSFGEAIPLLDGDQKIIALLQRGEVLAKLERHDESVDSMREACRLAPGDMRVRWTLAQELTAAGRTAEARAEYSGLLQIPGLDAATRAQLEQEYKALGE